MTDRAGDFGVTRLLDALMDALCSDGRRKFSASVLAILVSFVLALLSKLDGTQFVSALGIIFALFTTGNALEHRAKNGVQVSSITTGGST